MDIEKVELDIDILHRTDLAIMVENLNEETVWIPISQIDISNDESKALVPEWLAIDKELV